MYSMSGSIPAINSGGCWAYYFDSSIFYDLVASIGRVQQLDSGLHFGI